MAKPNPIPDLKQRVKTLEEQVQLLPPLIEEVRVLKERLDSWSLHGLQARKEEEIVGDSNDLEKMKETLKLKERELRETQAEMQKLKEESEREKVELRPLKRKYEEEHHLRLQQEERQEEALRALREELHAKGEELKKMAEELEVERQKTGEHRAAAGVRADLGKRDSRGRTQLHRAAEQGDAQMVQLLLHAGSQVNAGDHNGYTPLWLAAYGDCQDACRVLLAAGAQPDVKGGACGRTALHIAVLRGHRAVCELLLEAGARPNVPDDDDQYTALHWAAFLGQAPVVQLLLQYGAERRVRDKWGQTALDLARESENTEVAAILQG